MCCFPQAAVPKEALVPYVDGGRLVGGCFCLRVVEHL